MAALAASLRQPRDRCGRIDELDRVTRSGSASQAGEAELEQQ